LAFLYPNRYGTSFAEYAASHLDPAQKQILWKHMLPLKGKAVVRTLWAVPD
jgi:hypothetical protein